MRFFFTEEDELARIRATDIRSALVAARHEVIHGGPGDVAPVGTDVWMHGLRGDRRHPIEPAQLDALLATRAAVVLFQLCDASSMWFDRVPDALMQRTRLFLRNHWPSDRSGIPQYEVRVKGHLGSRWSAWFDGLSLTTSADGTTVIRGHVVDQSALHGLLQKVRDIGLPLISVTQVDPDQRATNPR